MNILILGATGRTGQHVLSMARAAGHRTTAFGRRASPGAELSITGEFDDPRLAEAVRKADAVLSCLASSNKSAACSQAMQAVLAADPTVRYVTVAGAGVDRPDDDKGVGDKIIGAIMRVVVGKMLRDRQHEVDALAASDARWTALRPPRLSEGNSTGEYHFSFDRPATTSIDRADLAAAMLATLDDPAMMNAAPFVSAPPKDEP